MNTERYMELVLNTVKYDFTGEFLQDVINELRNNKIATYKEDEEDNSKVKINTSMTKAERVMKCINENIDSVGIIEKCLIMKGYRYSIYYNCTNMKLDKIPDNYINVDTVNKENMDKIISTSNPIIYYDTDDYVAFKFTKVIKPYISRLDLSKDIMYPTLWVYHKKLNILEYRFDMLGFKGDDNFYSITRDPQVQRLNKDFNCWTGEFRTSNAIKFIIENKEKEVREISEFMGLKGNSLAKLKIGNDFVMPFIGDLENLICKNEELFNKNDDTRAIESLLKLYLSNIKNNATYKSRVITWLKEEYSKLKINISFSYSKHDYDLYNYLEVKNINMELMNYAIEYIYAIKNKN